MLAGAKATIYFVKMLGELGINLVKPIHIYNDNQSLLKLCKNPVMHNQTRHYRITLHFIRQLLEENEIDSKYISSEDNVCDIMTKPLSKILFDKHMTKYIA